LQLRWHFYPTVAATSSGIGAAPPARGKGRPRRRKGNPPIDHATKQCFQPLEGFAHRSRGIHASLAEPDRAPHGIGQRQCLAICKTFRRASRARAARRAPMFNALDVFTRSSPGRASPPDDAPTAAPGHRQATPATSRSSPSRMSHTVSLLLTRDGTIAGILALRLEPDAANNAPAFLLSPFTPSKIALIAPL
jgi:hypothetical protein